MITSDKFAVKLLKSVFNTKELNLVTSYIQWIIDSKYRTKSRLDKFLFKPYNHRKKKW